MATKLKQREAILAKVESSYRATTTPTAADDALLVRNANWAHEGLRMIERNVLKPALGRKQDIYGGSLKTITFDVELKGSGTAGTAPDFGVLLLGCGLDDTVVAATSVTYAPISTGHSSLTIWYYQDGLLTKLDGCRGSFTAAGEAGGGIILSFTFTGHMLGTTDVALISPTVDATAVIPFKGASFASQGYAATIGNLSFDIANAMSMQPDVNDAQGFGEILITGRNVGGSFDPLATTVAVNDWIGDFQSGANGSITTGLIGSTAGNRATIAFPTAYYRDISPGDRDGALIYEVPFGAAESTGDDEFSLVLT